MKIIKTSDIGERRFRASIYVDIFVPETASIEIDREAAKAVAEEISNNIPNAYVGDVASNNPKANLLNPMDRDI